MEKKKKAPLSAMLVFYCVTLVWGLLANLPPLVQAFKGLGAIDGGPYSNVYLFDFLFLLAHYILLACMLSCIVRRRRSFFIWFSVDLACKAANLVYLHRIASRFPSAAADKVVNSAALGVAIAVIWCFYFLCAKGGPRSFPKAGEEDAGEGAEEAAAVAPAENQDRPPAEEQPAEVPSPEPVPEPPVPAAASATVPQAAAAVEPAPAVKEPVPVPAIPVPAIPVPAVSVPAVSVPAVSVPAVSVPAVSAPAVSAPAVSAPAVSAPGPASAPAAGPAPDRQPLPSPQHRFCSYCGSVYGPHESHCPGCGRRVRFVLTIPAPSSGAGRPAGRPKGKLQPSPAPAGGKTPFLVLSVLSLFLCLLGFAASLLPDRQVFLHADTTNTNEYYSDYSIEIKYRDGQNSRDYFWVNDVTINGESVYDGQVIRLPNRERFEVAYTGYIASYPGKPVIRYCTPNLTESWHRTGWLVFEMEAFEHLDTDEGGFFESAHVHIAKVSLHRLTPDEKPAQLIFSTPSWQRPLCLGLGALFGALACCSFLLYRHSVRRARRPVSS